MDSVPIERERAYKAFRSHVGRGQTSRRLVGIDNQPRGAVLECGLANEQEFETRAAYDLVQSLRSSKSRRTGSDDEHIDTAVESFSTWIVGRSGGR
jgi:hypothetical protein